MSNPRPWGTFERWDGDSMTEIHVCPCTEDGYAAPGHVIDEVCLCEPEIIVDPQSLCRIILHHRMDQ